MSQLQTPPDQKAAYPRYKLIGLFLGILVFAVILLIPSLPGLPRVGQSVLALVALMVVWWVTEAIPIGMTALLPLVLCPILGIAGKKVTELDINLYTSYADPSVMMCLGIFMFSACIVKWGLHKRIALHVVKLVGGKPTRIILGFLLATTVISMWISNTTATAMMLPLAAALVMQLGLTMQDGMAKALVLAIPYGASAGGLATLIGSGTNVSGVALMQELSGQEVTFFEWLKIGLPVTIVLMPVIWLILCKLFKVKETKVGDSSVIDDELSALGPMSRGEKMVLVIFILAMLTFMTRKYTISALFPLVTDETVAVIMGLILFVIPVDLKSGVFLLDIKTAINGISWNTFLLLGGATCMGQLMSKTGIAEWIADGMGFLSSMPTIVMLLVLGTIVMLLTEVCTNLVVAVAFLPMIYGLAVTLGFNPFLMMFVVTLGAGCAWMMPTGTPPNALAFGTGYIEIKDMVRAGLILKVCTIILLPVAMYLISMPLTSLF
ncbi:DASS family sodium-coupled anion symporter [Flavonifractor sp. DFI.6.63]|uniref:SLC13 family permease n=1 Tax=Flavonifractor sp. DFI.6.63 TaxID=2963704 RepID=UPI00210C5A2A|nr:DASS family sodium-coupled anion symporter [Flavonifractor sp. DFI.6.63]MCQ5028051.1 DASS family sodium-coupled anion symporter [Flavonifractor sp. DFI.6.63]